MHRQGRTNSFCAGSKAKVNPLHPMVKNRYQEESVGSNTKSGMVHCGDGQMQPNDWSNVRSSVDLLSSKENNHNHYIHHNVNLNEPYQIIRTKERRLRKMKRHHSEQLRRHFDCELDFISNCGQRENQIDERVDNLERTVKLLKFVRGVIEHGNNQEKAMRTEYQFGIDSMMDSYEFQLTQKESEIRQLKRRIRHLESTNCNNPDPGLKESRHSALRHSIRSHLEDSFGIPKPNMECSLGNSRQSLKSSNGINLDAFFNQRTDKELGHSMASLRQMRHDNSHKGNQENQHVLDDYVVYDCIEGDTIPNLQQIDEYQEARSSSRGYLTARLGDDEFCHIKVTPPGVATVKQSDYDSCSVNVQTSCQTDNHIPRAQSNGCQTESPTVVEMSVQVDLEQTSQRQKALSTQTQTETQPLSATLQPSEASAQSVVKNKPQVCSRIFESQIQPCKESLKRKIMTHSQEVSTCLNTEYLGSRFKANKSITKLVVQLLSQLWRMVSKSIKNCNNTVQKQSLSEARQKIHKFTDGFNSTYTAMKSPKKSHIEQSFYIHNLKELKEIETLLTSITSRREST